MKLNDINWKDWQPTEVATLLFVIRGDQILLIRKKRGLGAGKINGPGGRIEPGETPHECAIRETQEESAWQFIPQAVTGIYLWKHPGNGETFLRVAVCGSCINHDEQQPLDDGILKAVWKSREELVQDPHKLRSPMVINCIDDYLAGKRYPLDMLINVP